MLSRSACIAGRDQSVVVGMHERKYGYRGYVEGFEMFGGVIGRLVPVVCETWLEWRIRIMEWGIMEQEM
jgi:hypothetical protein